MMQDTFFGISFGGEKGLLDSNGFYERESPIDTPKLVELTIL